MSSSVVAKKVPAGTLANDGKAGRIRRLVDYILAPETDNAAEKCVHWSEQGFGISDGRAIKQQMILSAEAATRSSDTVAHYVISWQAGLAPSNRQIDDAAKELLSALGAAEHRAVWAAHSDTDNIHVHVVLDRVHPLTDRVLDLYRDVPKIHRAAKTIALAQGWGPVMDSRYTVDRAVARDREPALSQKAILMEAKTGTISAQRYAQTVVPDAIAGAKSWEDLHARLAQAGLSYAPQGSGAVIRIGDTGVKASRVSRSASLSRLEKTFGPFRPAGPATHSTPERKAILGEFLIARDAHRAAQDAERKLLGQQQAAARAALKTEFGARHKSIVGDRSIPWKKRDLMRRVLAAQRAKAMASLIETHRLQRAVLRRGQERFPRYRDWKLQKDAAAAAVARPTAVGVAAGGTASGRAVRPEAIDIRGYTVSISGDEVHYTLAGRWRPSMIDHGRSIAIYDANDAAIRAMLQLANTRWGGLTLSQAAPELRARFAELAKADHFALYDSTGAALSPAAIRHQAVAAPQPTTTRRPSSR